MNSSRTRPFARRISLVAAIAVASAAIIAVPAHAVSDLDQIDLGVNTGPSGIAFTPDGTLAFVALRNTDKVSVIATGTNAVLTEIAVGDEPLNVTVSPDGTLAYVVASGDDAINVIDVASLTVVGSPIAAGNVPFDVEFSPDGSTAYVAGYGSGSIQVIDVPTATVTDTVPGLSEPQGIAISPDGSTLWFIGGGGIRPLDTTTLVVGDTTYMDDVDFPSAHPRFLDISPDGTTLVAAGDATTKVYFFDIATEAIVDSVPLTDNVYALDYSPDGTRLFAAFANDGGVAVIDTATNTATEVIPTAGVEVWGLAMSPTGDVGYAANTNDSSITTFGDPVTRVSGADRYAVAINISKRAYPATAPVVYVSTGANYPDALSAGPAAAVDGGPLLLTATASLPAAVAAEITRLDPIRVYIVGGTGSVSNTVFNQIQAITGSGTVFRLAGADRYSASRAIVSHAFATAETVYITTGRNYPDALSASAIGAGTGAPVLLVDGLKSTVDAATLSLLATLNPTTIKIAGGPGSVSTGIESQLAGLYTTIRLSGADRYEASLSINQDAFTSAKRVFLATGATFPDALAGAPWAGLVDAPLFSVPKTCIPADTLAEIISLGATQVTLLGGPGSLTQAVFDLTACP